MSAIATLSRTEVLAHVIELIGVCLKSSVAIQDSTPLLEIHGFDSIVIVDLLEKLENSFGVGLEPEEITPEVFTTPQRLTDAILANIARKKTVHVNMRSTTTPS